MYLQYGGNINMVNDFGYNAMYEADYDVLQLLVKEGVDINTKDKNGLNVLFYYDDLKRIKFLVEQGIKIEKDNLGNTVLITGAIKEKEALNYLIDNKIVDVNEIDELGHSALYHNIKNYKYSNYLIEKGANIKDKSIYDGMDIVDFSRQAGNEELADFILKKRSKDEKNLLLNNLEKTSDNFKKRKRFFIKRNKIK